MPHLPRIRVMSRPACPPLPSRTAIRRTLGWLLPALAALLVLGLNARRKAPLLQLLRVMFTLLVALPLVLVAMIFTRDQVRESSFALAGLGDAPWIEPQWGPIAIFAVLLVAALATIAWMLSALARGK